MSRRWTPLPFAIAAVLALGGSSCSDEPSFTYEGLVLDTDGEPIPGADVETQGNRTRTASDGTYEVQADSPDAWVRVRADGFLSRTRASRHDEALLVRVTPDADQTVSLHFAGDTMAGRRFYDPDEDGDPSDGQLSVEPTLREHEGLLAEIQPLLSDADLTVVNLETPLTDDPWYDSTGSRPTSFHPTKDFAFSSHPQLAEALRGAGVDVVDLANNHLYDRLAAGLEQTIRVLDDAGIVHYGAGATVEEAWRPAIIERKGQRIAFLGCTTITGDEHEIRYVADERQGGGASCEPDQLREAVRSAAARVDAVVVSIHGGFEYGAEPSERVRGLTEDARAAGAELIVNHHPHVIGGLASDGSAIVAENMGNFVFDQTIWQTFPGFLLRAELRDGDPVRAYAEPIIVADYRPRGLTSGGAGHVQRVAAGLGGDEAVMEAGAVELDLRGTAGATKRTFVVEDPGGGLFRLAPGVEIVDVGGTPHRLGRDVLRVGDFEDHQVGDDDSHWSFWELQAGRDVAAGLGRGSSMGAEISRTSGDSSAAFFNPRHRILLEGETELTFTGWIRADAGTDLRAQLSWYPDTKGPSSTRTIQQIDVDDESAGWVPFRLDATVPPGSVAVGTFLRLEPPASGRRSVRMDDLSLIVWSGPGTDASPRHDFVDVDGRGSLDVAVRYLEGGRGWASQTLERPHVMPVG